jgi:hypothetical protein
MLSGGSTCLGEGLVAEPARSAIQLPLGRFRGGAAGRGGSVVLIAFVGRLMGPAEAGAMRGPGAAGVGREQGAPSAEWNAVTDRPHPTLPICGRVFGGGP